MRYVAELSQSRFTVQAFATGMLSGLGHSPTFAVRDFTGELHFEPENPAESSVHLTVKADSLTLTDSVSAKDCEEIESRMRQEVLGTATYAEIVFHSIEVQADKIADDWYRLQIAGDLSLHGVKKRQPLDAQLRLWEDQARLSGRGTLLQSAYGIKPVSALGGMLKLKGELKLDFDIVWRKQEG